jgi:hypothetical protein
MAETVAGYRCGCVAAGLHRVRRGCRSRRSWLKVAGLFGADGHRIAGNIEDLPPGLAPTPTDAVVVRVDGGSRRMQKVRLAARSLPSGEVLVIGRNIDEITDIAGIVGRALALGLLPAFGLAVARAGAPRARAQARCNARRITGSR